MFPVPQVVRNKAAAAGASWWIERLPDLVAELSRDWGITIGDSIGGGTESLVVEARLADGRAAALKLLLPHEAEAASNEITVLRLADGGACPRLFQHDEARGALLMERLGRSLYALDVPVARRQEILCAAAARLWRPAASAGLPSGADKALWLSSYITESWAELERPCDERAIDHALTCAASRRAVHDDERAVLVHGDVHAGNALQADGGFKLVDPDGLLAEPEYDLGTIMREDSLQLLEEGSWARARRLAALSGLDAIAIWEWGVVERVSTGLLCTRIDLQPTGREMLHAAEVVAADRASS